MKEGLDLLKQDNWRFIDQTTVQIAFDALQSFATDDTLCRSVGSQISPPTTRAWVHHNTISMGIQDTKLPDLKKGINYFKEQGYRAVVRNSGGLAVVLDEGVLNLSLVFPDVERGIAIDRGYETMFALIKHMFPKYAHKMEAREIVGSYCPGSYDLSISGKKFAGISQRRMAKGVAVQIYLAVNGDQQKRAELIREFYRVSGKDRQEKYAFPDVDPSVMTTLSEMFEESLEVNDVMVKLLNALHYFSGKLESSRLMGEELDWYVAYYQRLILRNEKILANL
ncbi:lipoate--protein ligase family protein [Listeria weihenstephanensis]|uniref:Lipoyl-[GcvH]:protein N-lipoyltransferase n=1 Tax=Listeria weihenstephanensis TaxID=1006155 RepID=A0A841Z5R3_9LIST|nr:biotin/lipoate A/B protein ligase family protein [Listeria weihenstephanensis]MBC1499666.1 lipoate--protein ligase family protein [Listeria weihenstephanensis]